MANDKENKVYKIQGTIGFRNLTTPSAPKDDKLTKEELAERAKYNVVILIDDKKPRDLKELEKEFSKLKKKKKIRGDLPKKDTPFYKGLQDPKIDEDSDLVNRFFLKASSKFSPKAGYIKGGSWHSVDIEDQDALFAQGSKVIVYVSLWSAKDHDVIGANLNAIQFLSSEGEAWVKGHSQISDDDMIDEDADIDEDDIINNKSKKSDNKKSDSEKSKKSKKDKKSKKSKKDKK
jgi:hypothetical protein